MLHTLHRSPWQSDFTSLQRLLAEGDALLLLQDGVIAAIEGSHFLETLRNAPITVYALKEDIDARGLGGQISDSVVRVSYTDFVRLTIQHTSQLAW
ncbi:MULTISPECIES: sulfurtransferase complex subunit TusB [Citrobacter]|uniref:Protein TusB n=1 Tax=Citrobacter sedlakii TaxID=67826 RepID=A0ABS0ZU49_9ENTR|nr:MULTISPECIES: sulfurtransferase complex subunit TusB [Citrobacter]EHG7580867.1 sulfurtransferase complex subunit TusB [Citrobacter sedlakii]EHG7611067.1 sulfurtransferase complex subunit TusB [Citrobacter sedlakii]EIQ7157168.1 sulfurtransferase complex subunit TusB [Citrobacter sedlakii]EKX8503715.1 sulfurtransferase complex subunit TusB [Citrobacter sedlakii]KSY24468.1 sulfur relay protein TusB [Citrobacter sp. 50677481]